MKKMTQIIESENNDSVYRVRVELILSVKASNEGEVSYLVEDSLNALTLNNEFIITDVDKINNFEKKIN